MTFGLSGPWTCSSTSVLEGLHGINNCCIVSSGPVAATLYPPSRENQHNWELVDRSSKNQLGLRVNEADLVVSEPRILQS